MQDKIKVLFICHGNICRSPMAEFVMKKLVSDAGAHRPLPDRLRGHQHRGNLERHRESGVSAGEVGAGDGMGSPVRGSGPDR